VLVVAVVAQTTLVAIPQERQRTAAVQEETLVPELAELLILEAVEVVAQTLQVATVEQAVQA
jgi:hypothetical protein